MDWILKNIPHVSREMLTSQAQPTTRTQKAIQFPLLRALLSVLFLLPLPLLNLYFSITVLETFSGSTYMVLKSVRDVILFFAFIGVYRFYINKVEKRETFEFGTKNLLREFFFGFSISLFLICGFVGLMTIGGYYSISHVRSVLVIIDCFFMFGIGAFLQVLIFRVILFRHFEELGGTVAASATIALIFGFAHLFNENATVWTSFALMFADIMITASFVLTRRIWCAWGIHMGWNFLQAGVFGMPNSGIQFKGFIESAINGPWILTGGTFGVEASPLMVGCNVLVGIFLFWFAAKKNQIIPFRQATY